MREAIKMNQRAIGILYKNYPKVLLSRFSYEIWTALTPYVGIFLSAQIIEELTGAKDVERLQFLVWVTLGAAAGIGLVTTLLNKWKETENAGIYHKIDFIYTKKLLDMDYVDREKASTNELLSTIQGNMYGTGKGITASLAYYEDIFHNICVILGGIVLTASLFLSPVSEDMENYAILNHPLMICFVIVCMLAVTALAPFFSNKANDYLVRHAKDHNLSNRLFSFFGFLGNKKEIAEDMRIYEQDKICATYNLDKNSIFNSNGLYAKMSRGKVGAYVTASAVSSVLFTGIAYFYVCIKAWAGAFGLGMVTQYVAAITRVSGGMARIMENLGEMKSNGVFLKQTFSFLDIPNHMYQGSLTVEKRSDRNYNVEFRNVSFRYPNSDRYALRHVNMKFEIGKRLAVVGTNGSGKSTFIKLLCRLYDPTEGEILLNGIDIRKYNYEEYMSIFSVVFQDFELFGLKIGENVSAKLGYDKKLAKEALEKAGFSERLNTLPKGMETYIYKDFDKDGIQVSGGEAQKIAIARAVYKDAPFIILDEPTAALDPIAEAEIYSKFNEIAGDRTAIYISHRLSSCKFCDEILVFDDGNLVQQGTHSALVKEESGKYAALWNAQAQYYT